MQPLIPSFLPLPDPQPSLFSSLLEVPSPGVLHPCCASAALRGMTAPTTNSSPVAGEWRTLILKGPCAAPWWVLFSIHPAWHHCGLAWPAILSHHSNLDQPTAQEVLTPLAGLPFSIMSSLLSLTICYLLSSRHHFSCYPLLTSYVIPGLCLYFTCM